jgi:hypothetical protein
MLLTTWAFRLWRSVYTATPGCSRAVLRASQIIRIWFRLSDVQGRHGAFLCFLIDRRQSFVTSLSDTLLCWMIALFVGGAKTWHLAILSSYLVGFSRGVLVQPGGQMASCGNGADSLPLRRCVRRVVLMEELSPLTIVVLGILSPRGSLLFTRISGCHSG